MSATAEVIVATTSASTKTIVATTKTNDRDHKTIAAITNTRVATPVATTVAPELILYSWGGGYSAKVVVIVLLALLLVGFAVNRIY